MGVAILNGAENWVVARVTIHHQGARQPPGAKDFQGHLGRAALPEPEQAQEQGAKEPRISVPAIVTPARLIRVLDRRPTVFLEQAFRNRFQPGGQVMQGSQQAAAVQP